MEELNGELPISSVESRTLNLVNQACRRELQAVPIPADVSVSHLVRDPGYEINDMDSPVYLKPNVRENIRCIKDENGLIVINVPQGTAMVAALNEDTVLVTGDILSCNSYAMRLQSKDGDQRNFFALLHFTEDFGIYQLEEYIRQLQTEFKIQEVFSTIFTYKPSDVDFVRKFLQGIPEVVPPHLHKDMGPSTGMLVTQDGGIVLKEEEKPIYHYRPDIRWTWHK